MNATVATVIREVPESFNIPILIVNSLMLVVWLGIMVTVISASLCTMISILSIVLGKCFGFATTCALHFVYESKPRNRSPVKSNGDDAHEVNHKGLNETARANGKIVTEISIGLVALSIYVGVFLGVIILCSGSNFNDFCYMILFISIKTMIMGGFTLSLFYAVYKRLSVNQKDAPGEACVVGLILILLSMVFTLVNVMAGFKMKIAHDIAAVLSILQLVFSGGVGLLAGKVGLVQKMSREQAFKAVLDVALLWQSMVLIIGVIALVIGALINRFWGLVCVAIGYTTMLSCLGGWAGGFVAILLKFKPYMVSEIGLLSGDITTLFTGFILILCYTIIHEDDIGFMIATDKLSTILVVLGMIICWGLMILTVRHLVTDMIKFEPYKRVFNTNSN